MSRGKTLDISQTLVTETCVACSMVFAVPEEFKQNRIKDKASFYCPSGHEQWYLGESREVQLQREIDTLKQQQARLIQEKKEAELDANNAWNFCSEAETERDKAKAELKKITTRVDAGVCPHCNRSFSNVARHMKAKHQRECVA